MPAELEIRRVKGMGWRPSLFDPRDEVADVSEIKILDEVDPRAEMTPIYDQFRLGSCTANADARVFDYDRIVNGEKPFYPSRTGIYFYERKIEGSPANADTGAMGRDGFKAAQKVGLWAEADWPYVPDDDDPTADEHFFTDPESVLGPAPLKLERPYRAVPRSEHAFKAVLSNRQMIALGFPVFQSFMETGSDGKVPMPDPQREKLEGGHEIVGIGYLPQFPDYLLCANSWNVGWGWEGCMLMPWRLILTMASDFRTVYRPLGS